MKKLAIIATGIAILAAFTVNSSEERSIEVPAAPVNEILITLYDVKGLMVVNEPDTYKEMAYTIGQDSVFKSICLIADETTYSIHTDGEQVSLQEIETASNILMRSYVAVLRQVGADISITPISDGWRISWSNIFYYPGEISQYNFW